MHCELAIPGLLAAAEGQRLPAAEMLLARGRRSAREAMPLEGWLMRAFDMEAPCPAGALSLLGHGVDAREGHWARADPVHLQLMRDRIALVPAQAAGLSADEASALCESLNRHFEGRLALRVLDPLRWVARLAESMPLGTESPLQLAGRDVSSRRPGDALATELQMALHAHPVNEAREARGEPAINSLWLWGAGAAPAGAKGPWQSIAAEDPVALGLARLSGMRGRTLPASAGAWIGRAPEGGRHLAVLDDLAAPLAMGDTAAAAARAARLEKEWLAPMLDALRDGSAGMVTLYLPDAGIAVEAVRGDLRRFWRRPRALSAIAAGIAVKIAP